MITKMKKGASTLVIVLIALAAVLVVGSVSLSLTGSQVVGTCPSGDICTSQSICDNTGTAGGSCGTDLICCTPDDADDDDDDDADDDDADDDGNDVGNDVEEDSCDENAPCGMIGGTDSLCVTFGGTCASETSDCVCPDDN